MSKIYIYFHICTIGVWQETVTNMLNRIIDAKLMDQCTEMRVTVVGEYIVKAREILNHPKINVIFTDTDTSFYERPCLEQIRHDAENEDFKVLYLHSKGVSDKNVQYRDNINDWIDMMNYYLIDNHQKCIDILDHHDAVGVNCTKAGQSTLNDHNSKIPAYNSYHYSGNFWWSKSSYIKTLPQYIEEGYIDPELYIGQGQGTLYEIYHSSIVGNHYFNRYHRYMYVNEFHNNVIIVPRDQSEMEINQLYTDVDIADKCKDILRQISELSKLIGNDNPLFDKLNAIRKIIKNDTDSQQIQTAMNILQDIHQSPKINCLTTIMYIYFYYLQYIDTIEYRKKVKYGINSLLVMIAVTAIQKFSKDVSKQQIYINYTVGDMIQEFVNNIIEDTIDSVGDVYAQIFSDIYKYHGHTDKTREIFIPLCNVDYVSGLFRDDIYLDASRYSNIYDLKNYNV